MLTRLGYVKSCDLLYDLLCHVLTLLLFCPIRAMIRSKAATETISFTVKEVTMVSQRSSLW